MSCHKMFRKTESIHYHRHPEGVVYGSFCLNSGTVAVSKLISRRWWCIEYMFPMFYVIKVHLTKQLSCLMLCRKRLTRAKLSQVPRTFPCGPLDGGKNHKVDKLKRFSNADSGDVRPSENDHRLGPDSWSKINNNTQIMKPQPNKTTNTQHK